VIVKHCTTLSTLHYDNATALSSGNAKFTLRNFGILHGPLLEESDGNHCHDMHSSVRPARHPHESQMQLSQASNAAYPL
jgi:hypothetical protein